jgi:ABC-type glycerol-3-phosphate transport system permease component
MPRRKWTAVLTGILGRLSLLLFLGLWLFPLYWLVNTAFKRKVDIQSFSPVWFPRPFTMQNINWVLNNLAREPLLRSVAVVGISVAVSLIFGPLMAYALSRFRFKRSQDIQFWIISTRMLPPAALIMPYYFLLIRVNLINTELGLTLLYIAINLPLTTWIMLAYLQALPRDTEEAALIDGCTQWGAFRHIVLPATLSSIAAAALITTILTWNEFFVAFIVTSSRITFPIQVSSFLATGMNPEYGHMAAAGLLLSLPPAILAIIFRNSLISGLHAFAGGK